MIAAETANSLTIRQPDGREETVLRIQIDELRSTGLSYMPEGLEKQIDVPAMADLLAYLNGAARVTMRSFRQPHQDSAYAFSRTPWGKSCPPSGCSSQSRSGRP